MNQARFFGGPWSRVVLALAVLLVWGQSLTFRFVWDDTQFIVDLPSIRSLSNIPAMFTSLEAQSSYPQGFKLFRPLRTAHYAVLFAIGGGEPPKPWLFHLANLVWHGATVLLFYQVLLLLFARLRADAENEPVVPWLAFLTALAFAVHPVVSEVVCWAKGLDDMMAAAFVLGTVLMLLRWTPGEGRGRYLAALGLFVLALYSKLSAIAAPAFCFLFFCSFKRVSLRQGLLYSAPFFGAAFLFLLHRHWVIGQTSQTEPISGTYAQTLIDMLPVVATYLRLLTGLPPFCIDYGFLRGGHALFSASVIFGFVLLAAVTGACWWSLRTRQFVLAGLGLAWVGLFMAPVSNVVPTMQYVAERFLYLPLLGWLWALASLLVLVLRRGLSVALGAAVVVIWSGLAWNRSWIWQDSFTLFMRSSIECPPCERVEHNAVTAALRLPFMPFKTVHVPGQLPRLSLQSADVLRTADWNKVAATLEQLQQLFPSNAAVATALGLACAQKGRIGDAIQHFQRAAARTPRDPTAWSNLGIAFQDAGQMPAAETNLQQALKLDPGCLPALQSLAKLAWTREDYQTAMNLFARLKQRDPANPDHEYWRNEARKKLEARSSRKLDAGVQ
ncbi:MAG: tetratricopeptide repeat protein [Verrucomicrobia bacterium]|nr:tetratricopeptide repeat protein [Verrucomicrobiota bacterium]